MHDIDRTQLELGWETEPSASGEFRYETYPELYEETDGEMYGEVGFEGPFSEAEEMELAAQLLEITDEAELDQFLGNLFKKVSGAVGRVIKSPVFRGLGGVLKGVAKKALPIAGGALGTFFGGPVGGALGSQLASGAGRIFGLELEGLSGEDQEFEVARRYVRLAGEAAKQAALAPPNVSPQQAVNAAVTAAAQQHAPGLLGPRRMPAPPAVGAGGRRQSGRWVRRGRTIILFGA